MNTNANDVMVWMNLVIIDILRSALHVWERKVTTI